jgi:hypothetical protein
LAREGSGVDPRDLLLQEFDVACTGILGGVFRGRALGIANAWRVKKASATWRGVASWAAAISASTLPPGKRSSGKRPCPNGL